MTILLYLLIAMLSILTFAGGALVVFRAGEKEYITRYNYNDDGSADK